MMSREVIVFAEGQLLALLVFSVIGLVAVRYRRMALQREMAMADGEKLSLEAYVRFAAARLRIWFITTYVNAAILAVVLVGVFFVQLVSPSIFMQGALAGLQIFYFTVVILLLAMCIGFFVSSYLHDIVGAISVDAEALRVFQISSLQRSEIYALKMKSVFFVQLPLVAYFEAVGVILLLGHNFYPGFYLVLLVLAISVILRAVFALPFYALTTSLRPIEETRWASLAPRIAAWAQLAGVEFASVQVQQDLVGTVNVRLLGLGRPVLVISETFLRCSEWRQQDALIALAIGLARKQVNRNLLLRNLLLLVLAGVFVAAIPPIFSAFPASERDPLLIVFYIVLVVLRLGAQRFMNATYFDVDRFVAFLTGDPLAAMVTIRAISAFNGVPAGRRWLMVPSADARMRKLDELIRQSRPRAPQASSPVPSSVAVSFGSQYLTTPLDQATDPAPVPLAPYAKGL